MIQQLEVVMLMHVLPFVIMKMDKWLAVTIHQTQMETVQSFQSIVCHKLMMLDVTIVVQLIAQVKVLLIQFFN